MDNGKRLRGIWILRVGLSISCLLGLGLAGLAILLSTAIQDASRVLGPDELSRLSKENALRLLAMDESLLQSHRELLRTVVKAVSLGAGLVLISAGGCWVGILRLRRAFAAAASGPSRPAGGAAEVGRNVGS
jgi:hypothetical protein